MKNIYLLSGGIKDKPQLALSLLFMVVFLSEPFSGKFTDLNTMSKRTSLYNENHTGACSFFISPHDSAEGIRKDTYGTAITDKSEHTAKEDTGHVFPPQKCNLNVFIW
jgi:hypothetical protein